MGSLEAFGVVWGGRRDPEQGIELETDGAGELELKLKRRPTMSRNSGLKTAKNGNLWERKTL